jgi:4a-hydroxytetrahydrobiopterin dehydratase
MSLSLNELRSRVCVPLKGMENALSDKQIHQALSELSFWKLSDDKKVISRKVNFADFYKTMAFVNALAWIAHQHDHHPDLMLGYNYCLIQFTTHDVGGLSLNDFTCAAQIDALL